MFRNEVRFDREIAPVVGVRVPACRVAEETDDGFRLELEDLSDWSVGGDPVAVARVLAGLHDGWSGIAAERWPWLRPPGAAADLVAALYDRTWPVLDALEGEPPLTLIHGDVSAGNVRTSPAGEVALLDWEDVRLASGGVDLVWWLLTSVDPSRWDDVLEASPIDRAAVPVVMPTALTQALLTLAGTEAGSPEAAASIARMDAALARW